MKKRPRRKAPKPPPRGGRRGPRLPGAGREPAVPSPETFLQYKVVELSSVDEGALERTLNEWAPRGWAFEGVQFAMRESSKRPAMAFVFFTREAAAAEEPDQAAARQRLSRLAEPAPPQESAPSPALRPVSPHQRLAQIAGLDDEELAGPIEWKDLEPDE